MIIFEKEYTVEGLCDLQDNLFTQINDLVGKEVIEVDEYFIAKGRFIVQVVWKNDIDCGEEHL